MNIKQNIEITSSGIINIFNKYNNSSEIQQRIPNEVLSGLATAIASGHIYEIVRGLTEVQQLEEKSLFHQRLELQKKHSGKLHKMSMDLILGVCLLRKYILNYQIKFKSYLLQILNCVSEGA